MAKIEFVLTNNFLWMQGDIVIHTLSEIKHCPVTWKYKQ